jgi:hypothetical protein
MPDNRDDTFHFPLGRWLLWGLLALVAVAGIILLINSLVSSEDPDTEADTDVGPQVEWSIVLVDQTGDTVTLKGDLPSGRTTETWRNDIQLIRSPGGTFEWDMDEELPAAVVGIDASAGCDELNAELDSWVSEIGTATGEPQQWQARAFAQHALDTMREQACEIDESALAGVSS